MVPGMREEEKDGDKIVVPGSKDTPCAGRYGGPMRFWICEMTCDSKPSWILRDWVAGPENEPDSEPSEEEFEHFADLSGDNVGDESRSDQDGKDDDESGNGVFPFED